MDYQNFVFIRHVRIKTLGVGTKMRFGAIKRWAHQVRAQKTPNADANRFADNLICCQETHWKAVSMKPKANAKLDPVWLDKNFLAKKTASEIERYGITSIRKDATYVEELILGISPDWVRNNCPGGEWDQRKTESWIRVTLEFLKHKYGEKLLVAVVHLDEVTPHIAAFVLPVVFREQIFAPGPVGRGGMRKPRSGYSLAASELFSGRFEVRRRKLRNEPQVNMCAENQTEYARFCRTHGLDVRRGTPNSRTEHRVMRSHYHLVHAPVPKLPDLHIPSPAEAKKLGKKISESSAKFLIRYLTEQLKIAERNLKTYHAKAIEHSQETSLRRQYENAAARQAENAEALNRELTQIKLEAFKQEEKLEAERAEATSANQPISILQALSDLLRHKGVKKGAEVQFVCTSGELLSVDDVNNTFCLGPRSPKSEPMTGTLRALEAVLGVGRDQALEWMLSRYSAAAVGATLGAETKQLRRANQSPAAVLDEAIANALRSNDAEWIKLRKNLKSQFGLPEEYLDRIHKAGLISANEKGLPLFRKHQNAREEEIDTSRYLGANTPGFTGGFDPYPTKGGMFLIGRLKAKRLVITDSAMTAIMLHAVLVGTKEGQGILIAALPIEGERNLRLGSMFADHIGSVAAVITLDSAWGEEIRQKIAKKHPTAALKVLKSVSHGQNVFEEAIEAEGNCRSVFDRIKDLIKLALEAKPGGLLKPGRKKGDPEVKP